MVIVDPLTGNAVLKNGSQFNVGLEAYTITSDSGSLLYQNGNWTSLADQGAAGGDWQEANVSANRVSELKFSQLLSVCQRGHVVARPPVQCEQQQSRP